MEGNPQTYLKKPYSRILIPNEDGTFSAEILEFPGCFAEGNTADEAIRNLEAAAESWIEASLAQGLEIPEPAMNPGYGGKIALRLPRSLHRQAVRMAERDGTSLNQFLATAVASRLGAEDFYTRLADQLEQRFAKAVPRFTFVVNNWSGTSTQAHPFLSGKGQWIGSAETTSQPWTALVGNQGSKEVLTNG